MEVNLGRSDLTRISKALAGFPSLHAMMGVEVFDFCLHLLILQVSQVWKIYRR